MSTLILPEKWKDSKMSLMAVFTLAYAKLFEQAREDNGTRLDGQGMDEQCMIIKFQENDANYSGS
jgi:hypothetical protein